MCIRDRFSQDGVLTNIERQELLAASPFNSVYPESILKSADAYFKAQMGLYKEGAIPEKEAHLVALGTSAATKCQYCIPYHISELKRLGATENEIKTAVLIVKFESIFFFTSVMSLKYSNIPKINVVHPITIMFLISSIKLNFTKKYLSLIHI